MNTYSENSIIHCDDGETICIKKNASGWLCPVCATELHCEEPYGQGGVSSQDICPECKTQFGHDDYAFGITTRQGHWRQLRFIYLDSKGWNTEKMRHIAVALDIRLQVFVMQVDEWRRARGSIT